MLTQSEADSLIALPKQKLGNQIFYFPLPGEALSIPLRSQNDGEEFMIDINRGKLRLTKCTYVEGFMDKWAIPAPNDKFVNNTKKYNAKEVISMIFKDCRAMVNAYVEWLRQKITVENVGDVCEITTPFLDRHNDHLQIYVRKSNSSLILTDDGYTIRDLKLSGYESTTEKRKQILFSILNGFGARLEGDEILVEAKPEEFPQKKHNLIQAMLAINDLFVLAPPTVAGIFKEDVEADMRLHSIRYTPSVKFTGKSGLDHSFDFVVPASQTKPERILRAINRPSRQNITMWKNSSTKKGSNKRERAVHVGPLNAPVTLEELEKVVIECRTNSFNKADVLGWEWSYDVNEHAKELAKKNGVDLKLVQIPSVNEIKAALVGLDLQLLKIEFVRNSLIFHFT